MALYNLAIMQDKYNHTEVEQAAQAHWTARDAYRVVDTVIRGNGRLWEALEAPLADDDAVRILLAKLVKGGAK